MEMRKTFVFGVIILFAFSLVYAEEGSWEEGFTETDNSSSTVTDTTPVSTEEGNSAVDNTSSTEETSTASSSTGTTSSKGSFKYTDNFYIALGVGGFGLLIGILLVLSFILKPHNRWKK